MCGIFGLISRKEFEISKVLKYFSKLKHRGEDLVYIIYKEKKETKIEKAKNFEKIIKKTEGLKSSFLIGMNYFSIFGKPQIYENFVFNGEVYNIEEMKEILNLKSENIKNDGIIIKKAFEKNKLRKLDGIYAFAYFEENKEKSIIHLQRDVIGINPLFFRLTDDFFIFSSENKTTNGTALNPRFKVEFDIKKWKLIIKKTSDLFFKKEKGMNINYLKRKIEKILIDNILKQTKNLNGVGIYFSGGVDSTFIAKILQEKGVKFTCLVSGSEESKDVIYAEKVAEEFGFNYKVYIFDKEEVENEIKNIVYYIESYDLMKVSVAIPLYFSGKLNPYKVVLSGIGSEELLGGYERHKRNIKEECKKGLLTIWERDLYRDNVISFSTGNELRVPFLTKEIINYSILIPDKLKIKKPNKKELEKIKYFEKNFDRECKKYLFRKIAEKYIGIYAWRPKKAAQYGSKSEKIIEKIAKERGLEKREYLKTLIPSYQKIEEIVY